MRKRERERQRERERVRERWGVGVNSLVHMYIYTWYVPNYSIHIMLITFPTALWTKQIASMVYARVLLFSVDFDGGDCSREFTVSKYDVYYLKADPNPLTSGGAASCTVRFRTSSAFNIYVQSVHVQDCTAKLFFYDNDNTQKYPSVCPVRSSWPNFGVFFNTFDFFETMIINIKLHGSDP